MDGAGRTLHRPDEAAYGRNVSHLQDARAGGGRNPDDGGARSAGDWRGGGHGDCAGSEVVEGGERWRSQARVRRDLRQHGYNAADGGEFVLGDCAYEGEVRKIAGASCGTD